MSIVRFRNTDNQITVIDSKSISGVTELSNGNWAIYWGRWICLVNKEIADQIIFHMVRESNNQIYNYEKLQEPRTAKGSLD